MHSIVGEGLYRISVLARGEGSVFRQLRALEALEHQSAAFLEERQERRLAAILQYAAAVSPHYRQAFAALGAAGRSSPMEVLGALPVLTKSDLQERHGSLLAVPAPRRVTHKITGGSTGQAVTVTKDRSAIAAEMAASWLGYGWFGIRPGDRAVRFWGNPSGLKRRLRFVAADAAMNRIRFSAFAFGETDMEKYWRRCVRFRPRYLYGYASMLTTFARFLDRRGYPAHDLALNVIISTAEVLSLPDRVLLSTVFGCRVQNEYGCGELGPIAYECERGRMHTLPDNHVIEIVKEDGSPALPGESGNIVITDLNNRAMPLIRYSVGDLGIAGGKCECGRGFPVLEKVWGREYDFVIAPDDKRYHGEFFMYIFEDLRRKGAGVAKFKITQDGAGSLLVEIVPEGVLPPDALTRIGEFISQRINGFAVRVQHVSTLPPRRSGKTVIVDNPWFRGERQNAQ